MQNNIQKPGIHKAVHFRVTFEKTPKEGHQRKATKGRPPKEGHQRKATKGRPPKEGHQRKATKGRPPKEGQVVLTSVKKLPGPVERVMGFVCLVFPRQKNLNGNSKSKSLWGKSKLSMARILMTKREMWNSMESHYVSQPFLVHLRRLRDP